MQYRADLHIHSKYSIATSKHADLENYYSWARIKGIRIIGTGDFTHHGWLGEIKEKLEPAGNGFFRLKEKPVTEALTLFKPAPLDVLFCLTSEISSVFKRDGRTYRVHSLIFAPDLETVSRIRKKLEIIGNIGSDGRPILRLDTKDLLEIVRDASPDAYLIPAHIWTPWYSVFGSKSGFNSMNECFADLTDEIFALETGLSSDPGMNRMWSDLDRFTLVSNSDAHSPNKLGREVNLFSTDLGYEAMFSALKTKDGFNGTYEYFPEKGKYHLDGHRKCGVCLTPEETDKHKGRCPVCGKPLTIGVMHRVADCADRKKPLKPSGPDGYRYIMPLDELLSTVADCGAGTKTVQVLLVKLIRLYGDELTTVLDIPAERISKDAGEDIAGALVKLRRGDISLSPGFDGQFGTVKMGTGEHLK
ncbi:MAG: DNA helicase UvrD [Spirochaetes bacterium]|nr:DNA helicase UvrD [Spirochaetota bacterium]